MESPAMRSRNRLRNIIQACWWSASSAPAKPMDRMERHSRFSPGRAYPCSVCRRKWRPLDTNRKAVPTCPYL